jgi:hypothetical protein
MQTQMEDQQDIAAEVTTQAREQEVDNRRRDLSLRSNSLARRATKLRKRLANMDPSDEARAELTGAVEDAVEDLQWIQYGIYQLTADACASVLDDGEVVYNFTPADVKAWCDRAVEMGATHPQIRAEHLRDLVRMRIIPNAPFRARLAEVQARGQSDRDVTSLAHDALRQLEEQDGADYGARHFLVNGNPQSRHLERLLGVQASDGGASQTLRLFIPYETGVAIMQALGMTPQEAGL